MYAEVIRLYIVYCFQQSDLPGDAVSPGYGGRPASPKGKSGTSFHLELGPNSLNPLYLLFAWMPHVSVTTALASEY